MTRDRVLGVVPARIGSTRFPRKVLAEVCGRPLVQWTFERLLAAGRIDEALVATDSQEVESAVASFGGGAVLVREDCATGSDRVAAVARDASAGIVVNLQADQPLIDPFDIDRLVDSLLADADLDLTTLVFPSDDADAFTRPDVVKVAVAADGRAVYFSRAPVPASRDRTPGKPLFLHHVGIYCFRRAALLRFASLPRGVLERRESLEQLRALENGMKVGVVTTDRVSSSVDRPEDIEKIERQLASL